MKTFWLEKLATVLGLIGGLNLLGGLGIAAAVFMAATNPGLADRFGSDAEGWGGLLAIVIAVASFLYAAIWLGLGQLVRLFMRMEEHLNRVADNSELFRQLPRNVRDSLAQ